MNWGGFSTKHLEQFLRQYATQLDHKRDVMGRHFVGTAAYTRAAREAETLARHIAAIRTELEGREDNG